MPNFSQAPQSNTVAQDHNSELYAVLERNDRKEIEKYYQTALEGSNDLFDKYAGKNRPKFEFTSDLEITTAVFMVENSGKNPQIKIGLDFFIKNRLDREQAVWVLMHELTHFMDWAENRSYYMGQFAKAEKLGSEMAQRLSEHFKDRQIEENKKRLAKGEEEKPIIDIPASRIASLAKRLGDIYSRGYYNVINDIYVNSKVATTAEYQRDEYYDVSKSKNGRVEALYRDVLFTRRDLSQQPEFYQFINFLLRGDQIRSEGMRLTEGAQKALARDYRIEYTSHDERRGINRRTEVVMDTHELIQTFTNPNTYNYLDRDMRSSLYRGRLEELEKTGIFDDEGLKDTSLEYRGEYLDETLLPTFTELLFDDAKNWTDDYLDSNQTDSDSSLEDMMKDLEKWFKDILDTLEGESPDFMGDKVGEDYADWKEKESAAKKEAEAKPAKERSDIVEDFKKNNNIDEKTAERVRRAWDDIAPYIEDLNDLWRRITVGQAVEYDYKSAGEYRSGKDLNIRSATKQWSSFISREYDKLKIFKKRELLERVSDRPERIEISLVLDQSGSMNVAKNKVLERVALMLQMSLDNFNEWLLSVRGESKSKLHVDKEVIVYGNEASVINPFRYKHTGIEGVSADQYNSERGVENYKTFEEIGRDLGYTYNNEALNLIRSGIDHEDIDRIRQGKVLKIVFEITDGGSSDEDAARSAVEALTSDGVLCFGFQIGNVGEDELEAFNSVYNSSSDGIKRGYSIGEDYSGLPEIVKEMLKDLLGDVKIYD